MEHSQRAKMPCQKWRDGTPHGAAVRELVTQAIEKVKESHALASGQSAAPSRLMLAAAMGVIDPVTPLRRQNPNRAPKRLEHVGKALVLLQLQDVRAQVVMRGYKEWQAIEAILPAERTPCQECFVQTMEQYECKYALLYDRPDGESTQLLQDCLNLLDRNQVPKCRPPPMPWRQARVTHVHAPKQPPPPPPMPLPDVIKLERMKACVVDQVLPKQPPPPPPMHPGNLIFVKRELAGTTAAQPARCFKCGKFRDLPNGLTKWPKDKSFECWDIGVFCTEKNKPKPKPKRKRGA